MNELTINEMQQVSGGARVVAAVGIVLGLLASEIWSGAKAVVKEAKAEVANSRAGQNCRQTRRGMRCR
jgi:bacteriocin-like protein